MQRGYVISKHVIDLSFRAGRQSSVALNHISSTSVWIGRQTIEADSGAQWSYCNTSQMQILLQKSEIQDEILPIAYFTAFGQQEQKRHHPERSINNEV